MKTLNQIPTQYIVAGDGGNVTLSRYSQASCYIIQLYIPY